MNELAPIRQFTTNHEHHADPEIYQPDKPRLIATIEPDSRRSLESLHAALGNYWQRTYEHVPGIALATLQSSEELWPYVPPQARSAMTESRCRDINQAAQPRYRTVRTEGLIATTYEGVPVISLSLNTNDITAVRTHALSTLNRTFEILTSGGTVRASNGEWLSKVHDTSLCQLPLTRYPSGQHKTAKHTMARASHLMPEALTINCEPTVFGRFEQTYTDDEEEVVLSEEVGIVTRAIRAARDYPHKSLRLGLTKKLVGVASLPANIEVVAAGGSDYLVIRSSRAT